MYVYVQKKDLYLMPVMILMMMMMYPAISQFSTHNMIQTILVYISFLQQKNAHFFSCFYFCFSIFSLLFYIYIYPRCLLVYDDESFFSYYFWLPCTEVMIRNLYFSWHLVQSFGMFVLIVHFSMMRIWWP